MTKLFGTIKLEDINFRGYSVDGMVNLEGREDMSWVKDVEDVEVYDVESADLPINITNQIGEDTLSSIKGYLGYLGNIAIEKAQGGAVDWVSVD